MKLQKKKTNNTRNALINSYLDGLVDGMIDEMIQTFDDDFDFAEKQIKLAIINEQNIDNLKVLTEFNIEDCPSFYFFEDLFVKPRLNRQYINSNINYKALTATILGKIVKILENSPIQLVVLQTEEGKIDYETITTLMEYEDYIFKGDRLIFKDKKLDNLLDFLWNKPDNSNKYLAFTVTLGELNYYDYSFPDDYPKEIKPKKRTRIEVISSIPN